MNDRLLRAALAACAAIVAAVALGSLVVLVGGLLLSPAGPPAPGLGLAIAGSVQVVALALTVAVPLGVAAGVFLSEYGSAGPPVQMLRALHADVSAVPALAHGVFGFAVFGDGLAHRSQSLELDHLGCCAQAAQQQAHLGPRRAAIKMGLIEHDEEPLIGAL